MKKHFINIIIVAVMLIACLFALSSCSTTKVEEREKVTLQDTTIIRDSVVIKETHPSWNLDTTAKITDINPEDSTDYTAETEVTVIDNDGISEHQVKLKYHTRTKKFEASSFMKTPVVSKNVFKGFEERRMFEKQILSHKTVEKKPSVWEQFKTAVTVTVILIAVIIGLIFYVKSKLR